MFDRTGVVRAVQQQRTRSGAGLEAVLGGRLYVVQGAFLQAGNRVDHHCRRQFAAGQHVVADRLFLIHFGCDQALVDPFVATTEQDQTLATGQFANLGLGQPLAWGLR